MNRKSVLSARRPGNVRQVRELQAKGGIGELAIVANFGGLEHWKSIKTQDLFAKHVMPAFRQHTTQAAAD